MRLEVAKVGTIDKYKKESLLEKRDDSYTKLYMRKLMPYCWLEPPALFCSSWEALLRRRGAVC